MTQKKIFILLGHPDKETTCGHFAGVYEQAAKAAGHEVHRLNIGDLQFDPILHKGYHEVQALEPDLQKVQQEMRWADHIVVFYPNWWSSMPALLKGLFDRIYLPGFAFHFHANHMGWDALLKGKTGRVVITMDNWPMVARLLFGDYTNEISKAILGFSGIHPVHITKLGPIRDMSERRKERYEKHLSYLAKLAK